MGSLIVCKRDIKVYILPVKVFDKPFDAPAILVVGHQTDGKSGETLGLSMDVQVCSGEVRLQICQLLISQYDVL